MKPENASLSAIVLDPIVDPKGFSLLLDFMYTSYLNLNDTVALITLNTAIYLQMEHVADTCHRFIRSRHQALNMQKEEVLNNSSNLAKEISAKKLSAEKEPDIRNNLLLRFPPQECEGYIPNVFTTTGCYQYGDMHMPAAVLESSNETSMAQSSSIIRPAAAHHNHQCPTSPMEGHNTQHPQTGCLRATTSYAKGVICSPQSPLRSDCQPNSPTGSSSSINASMSLKQACDSPRDAKACNWKKYKFIVLNQTPNERGKEAWGGRAVSPSSSKAAGGHDELHLEEGTNNQREEMPSLQGELCSSSSDKPYKCDCCQAAFRYKGNLASHKTVHTGAKPYHCTICGAQFNRPANLKTHTRIHSGEKPYKCETCGSRFVQCEKCDLHFRHKSQLRLHLRQKHGAVTNTKAQYRRSPGNMVAGLETSS
ncbi:hypothetical protein GOODEAATRI_005168 [Goodea atripinnis]|uniref:C2H2-type domain-containing protein n=1 Tax=Goodea atripinnis TaxID=208336 RepID=A0ABV0MPH3_9TELE